MTAAPTGPEQDLPNFLLARIADDEEGTRRLRNAYDADLLSVPAVLVNAGALVIPGNVLAECEAKRRIVEDIGVHGAEPLDYSGLALNRVLRLLALPYADHPDYRDEWKP